MSTATVEVSAAMSPASVGAAGASPSSFVVEFRSALNGELMTEMRQREPCKAGLLQCSLAAILQDHVRPVLLLQGAPLAPEDVLSGGVTLEVIRRPLPDEAAKRLHMAREAVLRVKATSFRDVKMINKPPEPLRHVLSGILSLLDCRDCSWNQARKLLAGMAFVPRLIRLKPHQVSFEAQLAVQQTVQQYRRSFEPAVISRFCQVVAPLAELVLAFVECWEPVQAS